MVRRFPLRLWSVGWMVVVLLAGFVLAAPGKAQEEAASQPAAQQAGQDATAPVTDAGDAQAEVEQALQQWKDLMVDLRELRSQYQTAASDERAQIQEQWDATIARGEQMIPVVTGKVMAAYEAAPNSDRTHTTFLLKVLTDYVSRDRYEEALELGRVLTSHNCEVPEVYREAGVAAFALNEYELASQWLERAANAGVLNTQSATYREALSDYTEYWAQEQALREQEAAADDLPRVKMTTTKGDITLELFEDQAPETVGNFVSLVRKGFYDGLKFHRVMSTFMAQGGCPVGDGTAGPGYTIYDECDRPDARRHFRGTLSMAKRQAPNTGGSQFFITFRPTPFLDGEHTAFGRVIEGMDVVTRLQRIDPEDTKQEVEPDRIVKAEVLRARDHEYLPHKVE